jgi:hypothetical protein
MRDIKRLIGFVVLLGLAMAGCATHTATSSPTSTTVAGPADKVFFYRQQAAELRQMADRLEYEAGWYAKQDANNEEAKRHRAMAKDLRLSADEADQLVTDYRRQIPHNQMN